MKSAAEIPGQTVRAVTPDGKEKGDLDPADLQQQLLRFADDFSAQMIGGLDRIQRETNVLAPARALEWKILIATECCSIASGPNALANLLDMTVFVTAVRTSLEDYWQPKTLGASAQPMLEAALICETNIWGLAGTVLNPAQVKELRQAILAWRKEHPSPENVLGSRAVGFATEMSRSGKREAATPGSVFGMLGIDPLAGLDPATRELALTRLFAERALYVSQWMPHLLRWHTERTILNAMATPEVQRLITNSTQITESVDRVTRVAAQLPDRLSAEREALVKALEAQEKQLAPLVREVQQTLAAGAQMSASLNTTLTTFDALMQRFGVGETNRAGPEGSNAAPFRIQDYGQTAAQLATTARELTELLHTLDRTLGSTNLLQLSAQISPAVRQANASGKEIVDYAFWKGVLLAALVVVGLLAYRVVGARCIPPSGSKSNSS
jgi:hypothetical protein